MTNMDIDWNAFVWGIVVGMLFTLLIYHLATGW